MAIGTIVSPATWYNRTVVTPSWLQNVQDNVNAAIGGTMTLKSLKIDGTGGAASTQPAGTLRVSASAGTADAAAPFGPTTAIARQDLYKEGIPTAAGCVVVSGGAVTQIWGFGLTSVTWSATGVTVVTLQNAPSTGSEYNMVVACSVFSSSGGIVNYFPAGGGASFTVYTFTHAGVAADLTYSFVVYTS